MPNVLLSYRQTSETERQCVRAFAERLRSGGISVILDQFFLEQHPGGPNDGWDKWSSDRALQTSLVIIIGGQSWVQCFDKTQPPGTGLGAACEADDIRHRVYKANGIIETIRVVLFNKHDAKQTAMDPHGPHDESPFAISGFTQMLDAIARRLQKPDMTQPPADERRLFVQ